MNTKDSNEFKWDEKLVSELLANHIGSFHVPKALDAFKASKQSVSLDWKILEYGYRQRNDGLTDEEYLYKVQRIKDGFEVELNKTSVVDNITKHEWVVSEITSSNGMCYLNGVNITYVSPTPLKQPKPLFRTEDGVDIFHGGEYWQITSDWYPQKENAIEINRYLYIKLGLLQKKRFSKKEKAEEYILLNKPVLSVNDVNDTLKKLIAGYNEDSYLVKGLKEFAKSKL